MTDAGFDIVEGTHPIVPVMLGDAAVAARFAELLWARGVYAISFSFPVVPRDRPASAPSSPRRTPSRTSTSPSRSSSR